MAFILYDLILFGIMLLLIPWYLFRRLVGGKSRAGLRERLGWYASGRLAPLAGRPVIWIHAVSVGETRAAIPLLKALRSAYPNHALVLTNVTETGHAVALTLREVDLCLFFPLDASWVIRRVLSRLQPQSVIIVETEIWPNLVRIAHDRGIPLFLVNGRISDRSFPRYHKVKRLLTPVLRRFTRLCMQSQGDAERILALGAPTATTMVTGNLKFDMPANLLPSQNQAELRELYRLPQTGAVWVAGSTHEGEERTVLEAYRRLLDEGRSLVLVLVPRHPERAATVGDLLSASAFPWRLRSRLAPGDPPNLSGEVLLVDTLGEILPLYVAADIVFVGGSLIPVGGHNILEAALAQRPVIFGPHMHNFRDISQLILESGAGFQVANSDELAGMTAALLDNPARMQRAAEIGHSVLAANSGATAQTLAALRVGLD